MLGRDGNIELRRLSYLIAANRVVVAAARVHLAIKANPYWYLQPRVPAGIREGGRWLAGTVGSAAGPAWQALRLLGQVAGRILRREAEQVRPHLRRLPHRWEKDGLFPEEDAFDPQTRRIGPPTSRRPGHRSMRFRNERELREYLGPAGKGWEWHHIVEKRLAENGRFSAEMIHSTDNIIRIPVEVHRRITSIMSAAAREHGARVRRFWLQDLVWKFSTTMDSICSNASHGSLTMTSSDDAAAMNSLVEKLLASFARQSSALTRDNMPEYNRQVRLMMTLGERILQHNDVGRRTIEALLRHDSPLVRSYAAGISLSWAPDLAVPVLGRLLSESFDADISVAERLEARVSAGHWLYQHFKVRNFDQNALIEPLRRYGIELSAIERGTRTGNLKE